MGAIAATVSRYRLPAKVALMQHVREDVQGIWLLLGAGYSQWGPDLRDDSEGGRSGRRIPT